MRYTLKPVQDGADVAWQVYGPAGYLTQFERHRDAEECRLALERQAEAFAGAADTFGGLSQMALRITPANASHHARNIATVASAWAIRLGGAA